MAYLQRSTEAAMVAAQPRTLVVVSRQVLPVNDKPLIVIRAGSMTYW